MIREKFVSKTSGILSDLAKKYGQESKTNDTIELLKFDEKCYDKLLFESEKAIEKLDFSQDED